MFLTVILQLRSILHGRCRRGWCVLLFDSFEFFFELVTSYVIHLAQLVELAQSQACFAKIAQARLAVVLAQVLISFGLARVNFV